MDVTTCGFGCTRECVSRKYVAIIRVVDVNVNPLSLQAEKATFGTVLQASFEGFLSSLFTMFHKDKTQYDVHIHFQRRCFRHVREEDWDSNAITLRANIHGALKFYAHFTPKRTDPGTNTTNAAQTDTTGNIGPSLQAA